jgi:hypothetical protein
MGDETRRSELARRALEIIDRFDERTILDEWEALLGRMAVPRSQGAADTVR